MDLRVELWDSVRAALSGAMSRAFSEKLETDPGKLVEVDP